MNIILTLLFLQVVHWIADFIIQTDWQAKNKSKSNLALFYHIRSYVFTFWILGIFIFDASLWTIFVVINGFLHYITDYFTSRLNSYFWGKGDTHSFFISVGADQLIHTATLYLTFYYFFN